MSMPSDRSPGHHPESEEEGQPVGEQEAQARETERWAQPQQARPRMNVQQIHSWVDLEIQQALRRGEFENLPGAGKPLKDLDKSDPDWWVKGLIEREKLDTSAALPTVLALRQERRGFPESLAAISDEVAVRERLENYNARVLEDRRTPVVGPNPPAIAGRVEVEEMVQQWRALRADRARPLAETEPVDAAARDEGEHRRRPHGALGAHHRAWAVLLILGVACVVALLLWPLLT